MPTQIRKQLSVAAPRIGLAEWLRSAYISATALFSLGLSYLAYATCRSSVLPT